MTVPAKELETTEQSECEAAPASPRKALRRTAWLLFAFLSLVYLLTGKGFSDILDAEGYFLVTKAMVEDGKVSIKPELSSNVLMNAVGRKLGPDGRAYMQYGIGYPLVMVPFYVAGKLAGEAATAVAPSLGRFDRFFTRGATSTALAFTTAATAVVVLYMLVQLGFTPRAGAIGGLIFGLATYAWPYAKIGFYEPFLGLCQILVLYWAMMYVTTRRPGWLVACGIAAGWGLAAKLSLVLVLPVLAGYLLWQGTQQEPGARLAWLAKAAAAFIVGIAPFILMMMWYNALRTGAATSSGYSAGNFKPSLTVAHMVEAVVGNTVSPGRGLFVFSPVVVLAFFGIRWYWRRAREEFVAMVVLIVMSIGVFSSRAVWATMRSWGPRYIEPLIPLLVILAMPAIAIAFRKTWSRGVVMGLIGLSFAVQLLAISMPFNEWVARVKEETGSGFSVVFHWNYSPLVGQAVLLSDAQLGRMDARGMVAGGEPDEAFKRELRRTPDFWFALAYRVGAPKWPLAAGVVLLLLCTIVAGAALCLDLSRAGPRG